MSEKNSLFFGYANIGAGVLLLAYWYLYAILMPYRDLDKTLSILVLDKDWFFVNVLGVAGSIVGMLGLVGIMLKSADSFGYFGIISFALAFIGTVLLTGALLWDTIIWPILANFDPSMLDFNGPIYMSKTFVPFFIISGIIYSVGYIMLGFAMAKTGLFPNLAGYLLAIGAPLFGFGSMLGKLQVYPRSIGITLFSIGLIWIGWLIRS
jgi:hypothetical protein